MDFVVIEVVTFSKLKCASLLPSGCFDLNGLSRCTSSVTVNVLSRIKIQIEMIGRNCLA